MPLLTKDAESDDTYAFDFIGADAVYFADPDENVLEIICRRDAAGDVAASVTLGDATGLCEVGLPVPTLPPLLDRLRVEGGLTVWNGNRERFAMVGSPGASLIVVPSTAERKWLSSDKPCLTAPFEAEIPTPSGATHIRVSGDEIAIYTP